MLSSAILFHFHVILKAKTRKGFCLEDFLVLNDIQVFVGCVFIRQRTTLWQ